MSDSPAGRPRDVIDAYFAAINAEDWDALAGLWEPDAELYDADSTAFKCLDPDGHRVEVYWEPLVVGGS